METITTALYDRRRHSVSGSMDLKEAAEMHREIYRAIRAGKPDQARHSMEKHLNLARVAQASESSSKGITIRDESAPPLSTRPQAPKPRSERRRGPMRSESAQAG
jgi:GntR family transcriptional repressor for pyruvate dehydrogenase complex